MGTQEPPARRFARLLAVAAQRAGPSCALPGQVAPTEPRGDTLNLGVQFLMAERVRFRTSVDKGNMRAVASRVFAEQLSDSTSTMGRTNERRSSVGEHVASWFHRALERPPREEIENRGHARFALLAVSTSVALPMLVE